MADPIVFDAASARFGLPLLWAGQAQKEYFVNEAHGLIDGLLHCLVESTANAPPANPVDGQAWLVGQAPTAGWTGQAGKLALRQAGQWLFVEPRDGLRVFHRATGQDQRYVGGWSAPQRPPLPTGGAVVDAEARAAIAALVSCLGIAGIVPAS